MIFFTTEPSGGMIEINFLQNLLHDISIQIMTDLLPLFVTFKIENMTLTWKRYVDFIKRQTYPSNQNSAQQWIFLNWISSLLEMVWLVMLNVQSDKMGTFPRFW